jgi:hypothetical protein
VARQPVNQEWQETKPVIVVKETDAHNIIAKTPEVVAVAKPEVKPVVNTITHPVDLGVLQMVATDQDLAKASVALEVKTNLNLKRFNDLAVQETVEIKEAVNYELVETKVN